jgi:hypothetical protein
MSGRLGHGCRALRRNRHHAGMRVISVGAHFCSQPCVDGGLAGSIQRIIPLLKELAAQILPQGDRLAMQPVRRPVRRLVGPVAPYRPDLLAAHALPGLLSRQDIVTRHQDPARAGLDLRWNGRHLAVQFVSEPAQDR